MFSTTAHSICSSIYIYICLCLTLMHVHFQSTLTTNVSNRVRSKRHKKRKNEPGDGETEPPEKLTAQSILQQCEVQIDSALSSTMTEELYDHMKRECKQKAGQVGDSSVKSMLRQSYERRYVYAFSPCDIAVYNCN